jgi:5-hydroxyisourate hydrolase
MISTHILDTSLGKPASNVLVILLKYENNKWTEITSGRTNDDGRFVFNNEAHAGVYKLRFKIEEYFERNQTPAFFVVAPVVFKITDTSRKYHIPLLLNPFGYSTYRGS